MSKRLQKIKLGDLLVKAGIIDPKHLGDALRKQVFTGNRLGKTLVEMGYITEERLAKALSEQLGIPMIDSRNVETDPTLIELLSPAYLTKNEVFPLQSSADSIRVAMVDPLDFSTIHDIEFMTGLKVEAAVVTPTMLSYLLRDSGPVVLDMPDLLKSAGGESHVEVIRDSIGNPEMDMVQLRQGIKSKPIIDVVDKILGNALQTNATDIHLEPQSKNFLVRTRIDGIMHSKTALPMQIHPPVISRLKILANMDIAIHRHPQDGSAKVKVAGKEIELRMSTLPTIYGEKMVVRILQDKPHRNTLTSLGIMPKDYEAFTSLLLRPQGLILVTGPTGSGKTTTLYCSLNFVMSDQVNIISIEDPVEYRIKGVNQVQVNEKAGITFASGLRSILRQDPNIIMVGEIRDLETAEISYQASLTGHLVLTTLHTNNAVSAITRLKNIGIDAYMIASSSAGFVAQRLVRRNCTHCLKPYQPPPDIFKRLKINPKLGRTLEFYSGSGCEHCLYTGFSGQIAIYEILKVDELIRELIVKDGSEGEISAAARGQGMTSMEENGAFLAITKRTTPEEILRVVPVEEISHKDGPDWQSDLLAKFATPAEPVSKAV